MTENDILFEFERECARRTEAVRHLLREHGRPDLLEHFDRQLDAIRSGVDGARATWNALSKPQRHILEILASGRYLVKASGSRYFFDAHGEPHAISHVCGGPTVNHLMHRELISWEAGRKVILTEHGHFVLLHGAKK